MKTLITHFFKKLGPGLVTGASDDDPSGIATYSQAGAQFGLATLWTAWITYPLMFCIQEMCARIGIVTEGGLGKIIRLFYPKWFSWLIIIALFPAITFNIAADLAGMGAVSHMLIPVIPAWLFSLCFVGIMFGSLIFFSYRKMASILKWLSLTLFAYILVPFFVEQDWSTVLKAAFIPHIEWNEQFFSILMAVLGTTISPYLFFWQTSMSVEEKNHHPEVPQKTEIREMKVDVNMGMLFSNIVMFFIILTAGSVLYPNGVTHIETVEDAAKALEPLLGHFSYLLFSLGVIGTGLLATPILAGCLGYLFADVFGWAKGLDKHPKEAMKFYMVIGVSIILGFVFSIELHPIRSLIITSIIYGILAPFLIAIILHISNSKSFMGIYRNQWWSNLLGIIAFLLMGGTALFLFLHTLEVA